ncbi:MAG TPA: antitoxin MazE family protein [Woeseiaceae bacterium]|nr:antitoxin MazE family protein [Woeseiaceae bacterium]
MQIRVPDTEAPGFAAECRRQSRLLNASREEQDIQEFIEHVADWGDE